MKQVVDAIYEKGVFRPLEKPPIGEGQLVRITIETDGKTGVEDMLQLAALVYGGLSDEDISEIESIALDRRDFFGTRRP